MVGIETAKRIASQLTEKDTVYIAGPMTGIPGFNHAAFNQMAVWLKMHSKATIVNPARYTYDHYIDLGLVDASHSTALVMLPQWEQSKGAQGEYRKAEQIGARFFYTEIFK